MSKVITPQQLEKEGKAAYRRGDYLAAARVFEAASQGFMTAGDRLNAAEMANNSSVAFLQAGEAEAALNAVEGSDQTFSMAGDTKRQGMALGNRAAALEALDRLDEASEAYQQSADLLEQIGEDQLRANVMQALSALQFRMGRQLQALATMQSGVEGVKRPSAKQRFIKQLLHVPFEMLHNNNPQSGQ